MVRFNRITRTAKEGDHVSKKTDADAPIVIAISGLGTLFDVSSLLLVIAWSFRLAVEDHLEEAARPAFGVDSVLLPLLTSAISICALLAVPFVILDERAYRYARDWRALVTIYPILRWISVCSGLVYVFELYSTIHANMYGDRGLLRLIQAIVFLVMGYMRFAIRIRERNQAENGR